MIMDSGRITTGLVMIAIAVLPQGLHASFSRYLDVLDKKFDLEYEIDLSRREFGEAAALLERGDTACCRALILDRLLEGRHRFRLEHWPSYDDALARADSLLDNVFILGVHEPVRLTDDLKWTENNPSGSKNWEFNLHALDILCSLNAAYRATGDGRYLDRGERLIRDYAADNFDSGKIPSHYSWYDHSVAYRSIHTIDFWRVWLHAGCGREFARLYLEFIWRHAVYLEKKKYYTAGTNHGIYQNVALLRIALAFPEFRSAGMWRALAIERMEKQVSDNFTSDGIHREFSPGYHILSTRLLACFLDDLGADEGAHLSGRYKRTLGMARRNSVYLFHPDGRIATIGDTSLMEADAGLGPIAGRNPGIRWVATGGRRGHPPRRRSMAFHQAQLFVMRSGWGLSRPLREESCLIADFCPYGKAHQQDDYLSFELTGRGFRWIVDPGVFSYTPSDKRRKYVISPQAHNVIIPYRLGGATSGARVKSGTGRGKTAIKRPAVNIDLIESIQNTETRIRECERALERAGGADEDRLLLVLAISYDELGTEPEKARAALERIIAKGPDNDSYEVANQLLATIGIAPSDIDLVEEAAPAYEEPALRETGPRLVSRIGTLRPKSASPGGEAAIGQGAGRERGPNAPSATLKAMMPSKKLGLPTDAAPIVDFWITNHDYDYVEGRFKYNNLFEHARAILFVKPHCFLVVDRIKSSEANTTFKQLFHVAPAVSVSKRGDGFVLEAGDSVSCLLEVLSAPENVESEVIEGQRSPEYQGWYSGTFGNFEPAPVIQFSFTPPMPGNYFFAHLFVPAGRDGIERYRVEVNGECRWEKYEPSPIEFEIVEPGHRTTVSILPSNRFTLSGRIPDVSGPSIEVTRLRR